jgi:hypothetical protein
MAKERYINKIPPPEDDAKKMTFFERIEMLPPEQWSEAQFAELGIGACFLLEPLAELPADHSEREEALEKAVYRKIPPITLPDEQIRNVARELNQAWRYLAEEAMVILVGSSHYEVDQVRAQRQAGVSQAYQQAALFPLETSEGV